MNTDQIENGTAGFLQPDQCVVTKTPCCDEDATAQQKFNVDTFRIMRVGWFTALALALHNIPEVDLEI